MADQEPAPALIASRPTIGSGQTADHILSFLETLPAGHRRRGVLLALRAAFRVLRAERVTFVDPTARVRPGRNPAKLPTPAHREIGSPDLEALSSNEKLMALLVLVHAARRAELPAITLADVDLCRRRLRLGRRQVRLDSLTLAGLSAWLEERRRLYPLTANPHLFVNPCTAGSARPISRQAIYRLFSHLERPQASSACPGC